ncbi:unnamed protein product [Rotaria sp. Silwood2]|nr:unnamed protein product [Rotaria sp. Silwood2]
MATCSNFVQDQWRPNQCIECFQGKEKHFETKTSIPIVVDLIQLSKPDAQSRDSTQQPSTVDDVALPRSLSRSFTTRTNYDTKYSQSNHNNLTKNLIDIPSSKSNTDRNIAGPQVRTGSINYNDIKLNTHPIVESRSMPIQILPRSVLSSDIQFNVPLNEETTFMKVNDQQPSLSSCNSDSTEVSIPSVDDKKLVQQQIRTSSIIFNDVQSVMSSAEKTKLSEDNENQIMVGSIIPDGVQLSTSYTEQYRFRQQETCDTCLTSNDVQSKMSFSDRTTLSEENHKQPVVNYATCNNTQPMTLSTDRDRVDQQPNMICAASGSIQSSIDLWTIIDVEEKEIPELKRLDKLLNKFQEQSASGDDLENNIDALIRILGSLCKHHYTVFEKTDITKRERFFQSISNRLQPIGKILKKIIPHETWKALREQTQLLEALCKFNFDEKPLIFAVKALKYINFSKALENQFINLIDEMRREYPNILDDILAEEYKKLKNNREKIVITVLGSTKSSKSSFINFLLQDEICPTGNKAATARLTKITYGQRICLTLKSSICNTSESIVFNDTRELLQKAKEFIILNNEARKSKLCEDEVLIELPINELKNVELWDVPGFDENPIINERVEEILKDTNLTFFIIPQQDILRQTSIDFIKLCLNQHTTIDDKSKSKPMTKICFIISQIDKYKPDGQFQESKHSFLKHIYDKIEQELKIDFQITDYKSSNQFIPMCSNHLHSIKDYLECCEQFIEKSNQWFHDALKKEAYLHLNRLLKFIKEFSNYDDLFRQEARHKRMEIIFNKRFSTFSEELTKSVKDSLNQIYLLMKGSIDEFVKKCLMLYNKNEKVENIEAYIQSQLITRFSEILEGNKSRILQKINKIFLQFSNTIYLKPPDIQILKQVLDDVLTNDSYKGVIKQHQHTSPYHLFTYLKRMYQALSHVMIVSISNVHENCEASKRKCPRLVNREQFVKESTMNSITNLVNDVLKTISDDLHNKAEKTLQEFLDNQLKQIHDKIEENANKYIHSTLVGEKIDCIRLFCENHSVEIKRIHLDILDKQFKLQYSTNVIINENERLDNRSNFRVFTGILGKEKLPIAAKLIPLNNFKLQEVLYIHELDHVNVIKYYGIKKKIQDQYYILMPRLDCNLSTYLTENSKRLKSEAIDNMIIQIIDGLNYIHRQLELVHRDIKLQNILVDKAKNLFLIADLGGAHREPLTIIGTKGYAAPELVSTNNQEIITEKCDMYSLGVVIQKILRTANIEQNNDSLIIDWSKISEQCLSKEPSARPSCENILEKRFKNID